MELQWEKNWDRVEAAMRLLLDLSDADLKVQHKSWWEKAVSDALNGQYARLNEHKAFHPYAADFQDAVKAVSATMQAVKLRRNATLPPIVWIRLLKLAGSPPLDCAREQFERWKKQRRELGETVLYVHIDATGAHKGQIRERPGLGKVRGYSPDELLNEEMTKPRHWPYCRNWERVVRSSEIPEKQTASSIPTRTTVAQVSHVAKVVADKETVQPKRKTRRRNKKALERVCGTRVVAALEQSLTEEAARKKSLVEPGGRNRRPYNCELSLDELVTKLKKKYVEQLAHYRDSTLKSALPHFVSCPRGRPGGLDE